MHDKVSRLRQIIADAVPRPAPKSPVEEDAWARFTYFAANTPDLPALDDSPRARAVRDINRIVIWYAQSIALTAWLDRVQAPGISALDEDQIYDLRDHMRQLEDCIQSGLDSPYSPPGF